MPAARLRNGGADFGQLRIEGAVGVSRGVGANIGLAVRAGLFKRGSLATAYFVCYNLRTIARGRIGTRAQASVGLRRCPGTQFSFQHAGGHAGAGGALGIFTVEYANTFFGRECGVAAYRQVRTLHRQDALSSGCQVTAHAKAGACAPSRIRLGGRDVVLDQGNACGTRGLGIGIRTCTRTCCKIRSYTAVRCRRTTGTSPCTCTGVGASTGVTVTACLEEVGGVGRSGGALGVFAVHHANAVAGIQSGIARYSQVRALHR